MAPLTSASWRWWLSSRPSVIRQGRTVADLPTGELLNRYTEDRYEIHLAGPLRPRTACAGLHAVLGQSAARWP
jgi:hypothetical protein